MSFLGFLRNLWDVPAGFVSRLCTRVTKKDRELYERILAADTPYKLAEILDEKSFGWFADPWNGMLDFTRWAIVTVAKRGGDCDDFARLAYKALKGKYTIEIVVVLRKGPATPQHPYWGHVMLFIEVPGGWQIFSNKKLYRSGMIFEKRSDAVEAWYGPDKTGVNFTLCRSVAQPDAD